MKTKIAAALAALMLIGTMTVPAFAAPSQTGFTDVNPSDWFYDAVTTMADAGVVNGFGDGTFHPNDKITWAQFATILWKLSLEDEYPLSGQPDKNTGHWGSSAMYRTHANLNSCPEPDLSRKGTTVEDMAVTRAAAANYLWSFFMMQLDEPGYEPMIRWSATEGGMHGTALPHEAIKLEHVVNDLTIYDIPDWDTVEAIGSENFINGAWIETGPAMIMTAIRAGIINGVDSKNTFNPNGTLTRAQMCQMLYNAGVRGNLYDKYEIRGFGM